MNELNENNTSDRQRKVRIHLSPFGISLLAIFLIVYDIGFEQTNTFQEIIYWAYYFVLSTGVLAVIIRYFIKKKRPRIKVWLFDALYLGFITLLFLIKFNVTTVVFFEHNAWLYLALIFTFIRETSVIKIDIKRESVNPAQLFIISFLAIIITGGLLLMLPKATHHNISFINAMFTATSAVCVTGLSVLDVSTYFTKFGQSIIILLVQIGGLGIMTFASYFSYFFKGGSSYENQLMLKDMVNSDKLGEVFGILKKIILLTFFIELIGAVSIYFSINETLMSSMFERIFFSAFHSISGFCNAGFSTLTEGLYNTDFCHNYPLHLIISALFILGGLGFPIVFNLFRYLGYLLTNRVLFRFVKNKNNHRPRIINTSTKIILITTLVLITGGTIFFYVFEYNNSLSEHNGLGKLASAFFGSVATRSSGFNTVDISVLNFSTIMVVIMLMWIGASPGSTGGGIKTSTFAIAVLNFISLAKGKDRIEVYKREIADISVRRAFAIILLSFVVVGFSTFCIGFFDKDKNITSIAFECFSAYSTTGLSLGITSSLSSTSKWILMLTMFTGRVGMLTILIAFMRKAKHLNYRYPTEEILIN